MNTLADLRPEVRHKQALQIAMEEVKARQPWALVTGSSQGLGRELALAFARCHHNVIIHGRNHEALASLLGDVTNNYHKALCVMVEGDITEESTINELVREAERLDVSILVNNAGTYLNGRLDETPALWLREVLETNLISPILLTQALYPTLKKKRGMIVNINSLASKNPAAGESIYAASKSGLRGFAAAMKLEATRDNIRILDVYAGAMSTQMQQGRRDFELCIDPGEAADLIVKVVRDVKLKSSLRLDELDLLRARYE